MKRLKSLFLFAVLLIVGFSFSACSLFGNDTNKKQKYTITYMETKGMLNSNPTSYTEDSDTIILIDLSDTADSKFAGWYNGNTKVTKIQKGTNGNIILTARWYEKYTITYEDTKGATNDNPTSYCVASDTIVLTNLQDVEGFVFMGWYMGEVKVTEIAKGTSGNLTLTAKWYEKYTITYEDTKGATNDNPTSYTVVSDTIVLKNLQDVEGFVFGGWYIGNEKVTEIAKGTTGNLLVTAKWVANMPTFYKITYNDTKGATNNNPTTYTKDSETIVLKNLENVDGYIFLGWFDSNGFMITQITKGSTKNYNLFAKWKRVYSITYEQTQGLENPNPTSYSVDSETIVLKNLENKEIVGDGYITRLTFTGWYIGSRKVEQIQKGTTGDLVLTANWKVETIFYPSYTITYKDTKDATNDNPTSYYEISTTIVLKDLEDVYGYEFIGWYNGTEKVTEIAKGTKGNLVLTAKWKETFAKLKYELKDNYYEVVGLESDENASQIIIPNEYNGLPVKTIAENAFYENFKLKNVIIGDNVTTIGKCAFGYGALISITIGKNVTDIGDLIDSAVLLTEVYNLSSLKIEKNPNKEICDIYTSLSTPSKLVESNGVVYHIDSGKKTAIRPVDINAIKIVLDDDCEEIAMGAFAYDMQLMSITLPSNLKKIGESAFASGFKLVEIYNLSSLKIVAGSEDNGGIGYNALNIYDSLRTPSKLKISNGVVYYVNGEEKLAMGPVDVNCTEIVIDDDCTEIYGRAFYYWCRNLTKVTFGKNVKKIAELVFAGCENLTTIIIPSGVTEIYSGAFNRCTALENAYFQNPYGWFCGAKELPSSELLDPEMAASLVIKYLSGFYSNLDNGWKNSSGDLIYKLNETGYYEVVGIKEGARSKVIIPSSYNGIKVKGIGAGAFENNRKIISVYICDGVTSIGAGAFSNCALVSITLGKDVKFIDSNAFDNCPRLIEILNYSTLQIQAGTSEYGYISRYARYVYTDKDETSKVVERNGVVYYQLEQKEATGGIRTLGELALRPVDLDANSVELSSYCTGINMAAFYNCKNLTSIKIPSEVTVIGLDPFLNSGVTSVEFEDPNNWIAGSVAISSSSLSNPETALSLLKQYNNVLWGKKQ